MELLSGVHLLLGHVPVVFAAVLFGPWAGLLAGAVAGSVTPFFWGHPWAWVTFGAEGLAVGLLARRFLPTISAGLFWLVAAPAYYAVLRSTYPLGTSATIAIKSAGESLLGALLVQGVLMVPSLRRRLRHWIPPPIRHVKTADAFRTLLALAATLPLLVLAGTEARLLYHSYVLQIDRGNTRSIAWAAPAIGDALVEVRDDTGTAAEAIARGSDPQRELSQLVRHALGLQGAALVDESGQPVVTVGTLDEEMVRAVLHRDDAPGPMTFTDPNGGTRIAVDLQVPGEQRKVIGLVDLQALVQQLELSADPQSRVYVIDTAGTVLADSRQLAPTGSTVDPARRTAIDQAGEGGVSSFVEGGSKTLRTLRPLRTMRLSAAPIGDLGWRVVVERSQATIQPDVERAAEGLLGGLGMALLVVAAAAVGLSRALVEPVKAVSAAALRLEKGERAARTDSASEAPEELQQLGERFNRMADELARQLEVAERASKAKDEFLSIASHELKTPLTALKAQVQLLQRRATAEPERLKSLDRQLDKLTRLVGQLLEASALGAGVLSLEPSQVELAPMLARLGEGLVAMAPAHELRLDLAPVVGIWDELRLEQVFHNLIGNAIKYSPQGGPIEIHALEEDGLAVVTVADRGIGINAEKAEELFSRFARGSDVAGIAGVGVGLYVCREIVQRHGGTIGIAPREGGGTVVTVRLPVAPPAQPPLPGVSA